MRALVTGVAGFIGSTTAERLVRSGYEVRGVDAYTDSYEPQIKCRNVADLIAHERFDFVEGDLAELDLAPLVDGIDVVFHLAALPGVRTSWGARFADYVRANVLVTQRLLEACRDVPIRRFVYASSSSAYGAAERFPTREVDVPSPLSPYGVTKLAGEHLAMLYAANFGVPCVALRYFTVFGPRQRPDMAIHRVIDAALRQEEFVVFGTGNQVRDFTYVDDVVSANVLAAEREGVLGVFNIGGGVSASLNDVIGHVEDILGLRVPRRNQERAAGDPERTGADTTRAVDRLGWRPATSLRTGIEQQCSWQKRQPPS